MIGQRVASAVLLAVILATIMNAACEKSFLEEKPSSPMDLGPQDKTETNTSDVVDSGNPFLGDDPSNPSYQGPQDQETVTVTTEVNATEKKPWIARYFPDGAVWFFLIGVLAFSTGAPCIFVFCARICKECRAERRVSNRARQNQQRNRRTRNRSDVRYPSRPAVSPPLVDMAVLHNLIYSPDPSLNINVERENCENAARVIGNRYVREVRNPARNTISRPRMADSYV